MRKRLSEALQLSAAHTVILIPQNGNSQSEYYDCRLAQTLSHPSLLNKSNMVIATR
jgi:hypothetical protein